jgi:hypothetical protein
MWWLVGAAALVVVGACLAWLSRRILKLELEKTTQPRIEEIDEPEPLTNTTTPAAVQTEPEPEPEPMPTEPVTIPATTPTPPPPGPRKRRSATTKPLLSLDAEVAKLDAEVTELHTE